MFRRLRIPAIWILLLAIVAAAHAQTAAQPQSKPRRFLMWKATSPTVTIYLVGSIHVGDSTMYPLPQQVESAFAAAKVLAVEINIKNADQAKMMGLVQKYGMYTGDDSLSKHLSKETSAALDDFCTAHGLPRAGIEQLKPWVVAVTIAAFSWKEAGEDPQLGIDMHFLNESKEPQRIDELETMESQLSLFAEATEEEQLGLLQSALKQGDKMKDMIKRIQAAYVSGDPDALQQVMDEEADMGTKSLTKKLLDDRNVTMAARLDEYLKGKEPIFVVVGAAHIVGEKGVAKLLRDKGYKVEQVTVQAQ
ncbi:MAG TPA: TraB/GumN family protein [Candidatus Angelobacter sp.]|nr:TraB/GumN family protein [Candidatus Angelobacter sp.]